MVSPEFLSLYEFFGRMRDKDVTNEGTTIHLRSCYGGRIAMNVAQASGRRTTGWTGEVLFLGFGRDADHFYKDLPDYEGTGYYYQWTPKPGLGGSKVGYITLEVITDPVEYFGYY